MNSLGNTDFSFSSNASTAAAAGGQPASPTAAATTARTDIPSVTQPLPKTYAYIFPLANQISRTGRIVFHVQLLTEEAMHDHSLDNLLLMASRVGSLIKGSEIFNGSPHRLNNTLYIPPSVYDEIPSIYMEDNIQNSIPENSVHEPCFVNDPDMQPDRTVKNGRAEVRYFVIDPHTGNAINYETDTSCKVEQMYGDDQADAKQFMMKFIAEKELAQVQAAAMRKAQEEALAKAQEDANKKAQEEKQKNAQPPPNHPPPPDSCCTIL